MEKVKSGKKYQEQFHWGKKRLKSLNIKRQ